MQKKIKRAFLLIGTTLVFFLKAPFVLALEIHYPTIFGQSLNETSSLSDFVCYLFSLGTSLAIFISLIVVAFGGVRYLVAYGRGKFTDEAKDWIKGGILGLLIVACSTLIIYTINPDLTKCSLKFLPKFNLKTSPLDAAKSSGLPFTIYKEIPIGTLTENLLTRKMDSCYSFDQEGNPVYYQLTTDDNEKINNAPEYVSYDRADCLSKLIEGSQKKAQIVANLTKEVSKLMKQCDCAKYGDCQPKCDEKKGCQLTSCPGECAGKCVDGPCKQPSGDCCPEGVKEKIEHGPISLSIELSIGSGSEGTCTTEAKEYDGLDEFRCKGEDTKCSGSGIVKLVEQTKKVQINGENIPITLINKDKWDKLNLWQQLTYFKEKIEKWKKDSKILADESVLKQAKADLNKCYLAIPYVELAKNYESTNKDNQLIVTEKTFYDPGTNKLADSSKYCDGFNYENSNCLEKCNNMCPDASEDVIKCYKKCGDNDLNCIKDCYEKRPCIYSSGSSGSYPNFNSCMQSCQQSCEGNCEKNYLLCSDEYKFCKSQCANNGQCVLDNAGSCLFNTKQFADCGDRGEAGGQGNANYCIDRAYLCESGSDQYAGYPDCATPSFVQCSSFTNKTTCENSGKCAWEGNFCIEKYSSSFFYSNPGYQKCSDAYNPPQAGSYCYSSSADPNASCKTICPETSKCPTSSDCPNCSCDQINRSFNFFVPGRSTNGNAGKEKYSVETEKISEYKMVGPECIEYSYNDDPLTFYCETKPKWYSDSNNPDKQQTKNKEPLGTEKFCDQSGEVPVGQAVDDAKNWSNWLTKSTDKIRQDLEQMLSMMKTIGKAIKTKPIKDYCKCAAKYADDKPICKTDCQYTQEYVGEQGGAGEGKGGGGGGGTNVNGLFDFFKGLFNLNNDESPVAINNNDSFLLAGFIPKTGNLFGGGGGGGGGGSSGGGSGSNTMTSNGYRCTCTFIPCKGKPCDQLITYQSQLWNFYKDFYKDFKTFFTKMIKEPRSDIMKELTYSRTKTDSCSLKSTAFGIGEKLLSCTRVQNEQISPIAGRSIKFKKIETKGCYGEKLGDLANTSLTDNWFCCQQQQKTPNSPNTNK